MRVLFLVPIHCLTSVIEHWVNCQCLSPRSITCFQWLTPNQITTTKHRSWLIPLQNRTWITKKKIPQSSSTWSKSSKAMFGFRQTIEPWRKGNQVIHFIDIFNIRFFSDPWLVPTTLWQTQRHRHEQSQARQPLFHSPLDPLTLTSYSRVLHNENVSFTLFNLSTN